MSAYGTYPACSDEICKCHSCRFEDGICGSCNPCIDCVGEPRTDVLDNGEIGYVPINDECDFIAYLKRNSKKNNIEIRSF